MTDLIEVSEAGFEIDGARLVEGISFRIAEGSLVGLVGPNGAGKSTTLALLAGDLAPTSGRVSLAGDDPAALGTGSLARRRAFLPQRSVLEFAFTVEEVVAMGRHPYRERPERHRSAVADAMAKSDTTSLRHRVFPSLSGGEQQRTSFGRVLAQRGRVLLLDEPTAALDLRHQHLVMSVVRSLVDEEGMSAVAALHDLNLAARYADEILLMSSGRLVRRGSPREVLDPDLLSTVYGCEVEVVDVDDRLMVTVA